MTIRIIDISSYNPDFDMAAVKASGITGVYIKATEGASYTNPLYAAQRAAAEAAGLVIGSYHFFHPGTDAKVQADRFCAVAGVWQPGQLPPAADIEVTDGVAPQGVTNAAVAFMNAIAADFGHDGDIYTGGWFWNPDTLNSGPLARYSLWLSGYTATMPAPPYPWKTASLWQYTDKATVPGIPKPVDCSQWMGTDADFFNTFISGVASPAVLVPTPVSTTSSKDYPAMLPVLTQNTTDKTHVRVMQGLINAGAAVGLCSAVAIDGDFGSGTAAALRSYQANMRLTVDGACGQQTWSKLLAV